MNKNLKYIDNKLSYIFPETKDFTPFFVDFLSGDMAHRRKFGLGKKQLFAKALGLKSNGLRVLDLTAGLCRDAFMMACLGCEVTALERNSTVFALVEDALKRGREDKEVGPLLNHLNIINENSIKFLISLKPNSYDVIYFDPMFPEKKKSALSTKEVQLLQSLVENNPGEDEDLLQLALQSGVPRVVVKRPLWAKPILDNVTHVFKGQKVRYDMYLP